MCTYRPSSGARARIRAAVLAILLPLSLSLGGCRTGAHAPQPQSAWTAELALQAGEKLGGCAAGDVLVERPGDELAVVGSSGTVWVVHRGTGGWHDEVVARLPGEMVQCTVGDLDPGSAGDEIVVVGMAEGPESGTGPGAAYLIRRVGDRWEARELHEADALLHGACIHQQRAYLVGFSRKVFLVEPGIDGFTCRPVADLPGAGKTCVPVRGGIAVACDDGSLVLVARAGDGFTTSVIDAREAGRARLGTDGERIVVADDDGTLSIVSASGRETIHEEDQKLRGAVLADLDPDTAGLEAACAGYGKRVTLLTRTADGWSGVTLHEEPDRFHHLVAAELDGADGLELAGCGFAGNVVVLRRVR